jgi:type II secretory pathway pseudopilin PulG
VSRRRLPIPGSEGGFGLVEMLIALTMLAIGIAALGGVFVSGHLALRRASEADSATVLADKLLERFRAESWDDIALSSASVATVDSRYTSDSALSGAAPADADITEANAPLAADGTAAATQCTSTPTPIVCNASLTVPYDDGTVSEVAPDGRSYRIDTYVTWGCPVTQGADAETLGGSIGAPTCSLVSDSSLVPYAPVKVVTVVVRDTTTWSTVYRTSSTFDRLTGDSIPPESTTSSGTTTGTTTTGGGGSGSAPDAPSSVLLANGGGTGNTYINSGNEGSISVDVTLPSGSTADDVELTVSDAGGNSWQKTLPASAGSIHFTGINLTGWTEGTITISATASNSSGTSDPTIATVTMDVTPPTVTVTSPTGGATHVNTGGPFSGTGADSVRVNVQFCQASTWTSSCSSSPYETADATLSGGNWSLTLSGSAKIGNNKTYTMRAQGTDTAGNIGTSSTVTFST